VFDTAGVALIEAGLDGSDIAITRLPREEQRQPFENPAYC
jgi:hypothetical protein